MNGKMKLGWRWTLIALLGLWVAVPMGLAHGGAGVSAYPATVAPEGMLFVKGEDINPNGPIVLFLEGLRGKFRLGQVEGDEDGGFKTSVAVPPDALAGTYLLKAIGANGVSATFELVIAAGSSPVTREPREATDALLALDRAKSPRDWTIIGLVLGLSLLLGAWLIRPERGTAPQESS